MNYDLKQQKEKTMAKQMGIFPMKGSIDNITFFKTKDGFQARKKGGVDREKILHDPKYKRTREHMAEFGKCMKGAALIKLGLLKAVIGSTDGKVSNRLASLLIAITRLDAVHLRGERTFVHAKLTDLKGFDFNANATLATILKMQIESSIDPVTGECKISLPAYVPEEQIIFNADATHYRFRLAATRIDFETGAYEMQTTTSPYLQMESLTETTPLDLIATLTANSPHPIFLALTVEFVQEVEGGDMYPLKNGSMNPCRIESVHLV